MTPDTACTAIVISAFRGRARVLTRFVGLPSLKTPRSKNGGEPLYDRQLHSSADAHLRRCLWAGPYLWVRAALRRSSSALRFCLVIASLSLHCSSPRRVTSASRRPSSSSIDGTATGSCGGENQYHPALLLPRR
jgi:hypothetical protein